MIEHICVAEDSMGVEGILPKDFLHYSPGL